MRKRFDAKPMKDGRAMLNCAAGVLMNWEWNNIDMSPYARLRQHPLLARALRTIGFLDEARWQKFLAVAPDIIWWDLRKGLPFDNCSFDVVYHSHFFEHLDRDAGTLFLKECYRVLKPNGIMRIVVPDLEHFIKEYTSTLSMLQQKDFSENVQSLANKHLQSIHNILDMKRSGINSVIVANTEKQPPMIRRLERLIRGKAAATRKLMEHQWMYDRYSLRTLLASIGFVDIRVEAADTSRIQLWNSFNLDIDADGHVIHGPESLSLYMEAGAPFGKTCVDRDDGKSSSG